MSSTQEIFSNTNVELTNNFDKRSFWTCKIEFSLHLGGFIFSKLLNIRDNAKSGYSGFLITWVVQEFTISTLVKVIFSNLMLQFIQFQFLNKYENQCRYLAGIYMFKVNNRNIRTSCEICSELTIKAIGVVLVSLLLTLNIFHTLC